MASITSAGIGSGLDVNGIVEKLVAAEGGPARIRLDRKEAKLQADLSGIGTFKGVLSEFQESLTGLRGMAAFNVMNATSSNEDHITVSVTEEAQPGSYDIEVVQLATAQKISSGLFKSDLDEIGSGTLTVQFGRYDKEANVFTTNPDFPIENIVIEEGSNSLRGIKETINKADIGINASIIYEGTGYLLLLNSQATGEQSSIKITLSDDDGTDTDLFGLSSLAYDPTAAEDSGSNLIEMAVAQDAIIAVEGIEISNAKNDFSKVIEGLNISLGPDAVGESAKIDVSLNKEGIIEAIKTFVTSYNTLATEINTLTGFDQEAGKAGPLSGDAAVRTVSGKIRRGIGASFSGINPNLVTLASMGIDTQRDGTLVVDDTKLRDAVENNLREVAHLFAKNGSTTDALIRYVEAGDSTVASAYEITISQLASQGTYVGLPIAVLPIVIGEANDSFTIKVDGVTSDTLSLTHKTYNSGQRLAKDLQNKINNDKVLNDSDVSVIVTFEDNHLVITSDRYGSASNVELFSAGPAAARTLGLLVGAGFAGGDVEGTIDGLKGIGSGQSLIAQGNAKDLKIEVFGGRVGRRGSVVFSRGVAEQLYELTEGFLSNEGVLTTRADGLKNRVADVTKEREKLEKKLIKTEERLLKKFSKLDGVLGKMRSTGDFLTQQLASLPGATPMRRKR